MPGGCADEGHSTYTPVAPERVRVLLGVGVGVVKGRCGTAAPISL
jgi:hypothetical protein